MGKFENYVPTYCVFIFLFSLFEIIYVLSHRKSCLQPLNNLASDQTVDGTIYKEAISYNNVLHTSTHLYCWCTEYQCVYVSII